MRIRDGISMLILDIKQKNMVRYLKKNKIINESHIYYYNEDFQEEVYLDGNLKPHYKSIQFKGINIDYGDMLLKTNTPENNIDKISKNEKEIEGINSQLKIIKEDIPKPKNILEKLFGISIKIERNKNDNSG